MLKYLFASLFLLVVPALAAGQGSLSPPDRPPVPMSDTDQEKAREVELRKNQQKPVETPQQQAPRIVIPGRHVSTGNASIDVLIYQAAARYRIDPCLIISVMHAESGFNRSAVSPKGASGLMQLMPATAARFGVKDIFDPRENITGGACYLRWLLDRFNGDVRLALAGYNAGEGAVDFYGNRIPPFLETQNYVRAIYSRYIRIHEAPQPILDARTQPVEAKVPDPARTITPAEKYPTYNQVVQFTSESESASR